MARLYKKKKKKPSAKQQNQRDRFNDANYIATKLMQLPEAKAIYMHKAKGNARAAANLAMQDVFHVPEIDDIKVDNYSGGPGEIIRIRATDDVKVTSVIVTIIGGDQQIVETGNAHPWGKRGLWRMTTSVRNPNPQGTKIEVVAEDLAQNKLIATLSCSDGTIARMVKASLY